MTTDPRTDPSGLAAVSTIEALDDWQSAERDRQAFDDWVATLTEKQGRALAMMLFGPPAKIVRHDDGTVDYTWGSGDE